MGYCGGSQLVATCHSEQLEHDSAVGNRGVASLLVMQRRRQARRWTDESEEKIEQVVRVAEDFDWERIAQRDRQLRGAVLLQRSVRRFLNNTYDRERAARTILAFFLKYVLAHQHRRRRMNCGEETRSLARDRRLENATLWPPRRRSGLGRDEVESTDLVNYDDDQEYIIWGRRRSGSTWSDSSTSECSVRDLPQELGVVTHSTAPLTDSDISLFQLATSLSSSRSSNSTSTLRESVAGLAMEYEVFLWQHKQHALALTPCAVTGFPFIVDASSANISLPGMWHVRDGDLLVSINDCSTHASELSFEEVEQVLDSGVRPAILRFRRPSLEEIEAREAIQPPRERERDRDRRTAEIRRSFSERGSSTRREILRQRERSEASLCYVIWREEMPALGIRFQQRVGKPYPEVATVRDDSAASRNSLITPPVQPGDWLLSINDWGVRNAKFRHVLEVLHYSPRPLVLTFRRIQRADSLGDRTFDL